MKARRILFRIFLVGPELVEVVVRSDLLVRVDLVLGILGRAAGSVRRSVRLRLVVARQETGARSSDDSCRQQEAAPVDIELLVGDLRRFEVVRPPDPHGVPPSLGRASFVRVLKDTALAFAWFLRS